MDIVLDGRRWKTKEDFYDAFLASVQAPTWHGRNLHALWDSITGREVNGIETPYRVVIIGASVMGTDAAEIVERFRQLLEAAKREGHAVEISVGA